MRAVVSAHQPSSRLPFDLPAACACIRARRSSACCFCHWDPLQILTELSENGCEQHVGLGTRPVSSTPASSYILAAALLARICDARTSVRFSGAVYSRVLAPCAMQVRPYVLLKDAAKKSGKWEIAPWGWIIGGWLRDKWLKQETDDGGACNLL